MTPAIAVFTRKSAQEIIEKGGSDAWVPNPDNARRHRYLVCCRNAKRAEVHGDEPHAAGFLVAPIKDLSALARNARGQQRYRITFNKYARILCPRAWKNWRNPVRYTSLEELGIDPDALEFTMVEELSAPVTSSLSVRKLTIAEAKEGLAAMLGISPEAIEITIKAERRAKGAKRGLAGRIAKLICKTLHRNAHRGTPLMNALAVTYVAPSSSNPIQGTLANILSAGSNGLLCSIEEFGWTNPILVDDHNQVICGHCSAGGCKAPDAREGSDHPALAPLGGAATGLRHRR